MQSTDIKLQAHQVTIPTVASGCSWVDHGPVHMDENHVVIIPLAKAGDNNMYSLLQLPVAEVEGLEKKYFQTFRSEAVKFLSNILSNTEECSHQPQQQQ